MRDTAIEFDLKGNLLSYQRYQNRTKRELVLFCVFPISDLELAGHRFAPIGSEWLICQQDIARR